MKRFAPLLLALLAAGAFAATVLADTTPPPTTTDTTTTAPTPSTIPLGVTLVPRSRCRQGGTMAVGPRYPSLFQINTRV